MKKYLYSVIVLSLIGQLSLSSQNHIVISSGTTKLIGGNLVLKDTKLNNKGTFTASAGSVEVKGTATKVQSEIGGNGTYTFHNLALNKSANDAQLGTNISVNNQIEMTSGNLDLLAHNLTLGSTNGIIVGESETTRITSTTTGQIIKSMDLNAPSAVNPGNLGLTITSAANLGVTEIRRGHNHQTIPSGTSIFRHFSVTPTNNTGLAATIGFQYLDAELNGLTESGLVLLENNGGWMIDGFDSRDFTNNRVTFSNYDALHQYTLGLNTDDADLDGIAASMDNCPATMNIDQADVDNDMVGDACDLCPGGDDMVDVNMNNIIDACECQTEDLNLTGTLTTDKIYVANNTIISEEVLTTGKEVVYKAATSITLKVGFTIPAGTSFLGEIADCLAPPMLIPPSVVAKQLIPNSPLQEGNDLTITPNLVNSATQINYTIVQKGNVLLAIHDMLGQQLSVLVDNQEMAEGTHQLTWNREALNSGTYVLTMEHNQQTISEKIVVVE